MVRILVFIVCSLLAAPGRPPAAEAADWAAVGAVFAERCVNCHRSEGAARGLRLDSYAAAIAGGERGAVLIAGDPDGSELLRRLRGQSRPRMPFLSYPLPPETIDLIARWVAAGMPETMDGAAPPDPPEALVFGPVDPGPQRR